VRSGDPEKLSNLISQSQLWVLNYTGFQFQLLSCWQIWEQRGIVTAPASGNGTSKSKQRFVCNCMSCTTLVPLAIYKGRKKRQCRLSDTEHVHHQNQKQATLPSSGNGNARSSERMALVPNGWSEGGESAVWVPSAPTPGTSRRNGTSIPRGTDTPLTKPPPAVWR
jgi:hypothetical protein